MNLRMGTRGSTLALAQSRAVADLLSRRHEGLSIETVVIKTSGDMFGVQSPSEARELAFGTKGLFVKEIEEALRDGRVDFAVHSAKDLPGELAPGLSIAAYPEREDPRDVFIGVPGTSWAALKAGVRVATSSSRRLIQLRRARPGVEVLPLRGNVDTRLKRLAEGYCDGLILAAAGLKRLGRWENRCELIAVADMVPAPGQGALAVEAAAGRRDIQELLAALDHGATRFEVELERDVLRAVGGGCSTPLGVLARRKARGVDLAAFWADKGGRDPGRGASAYCGDHEDRGSFIAGLVARLKG